MAEVNVKLHPVQLLRAIAALLVVCWHAQLMIPQFPNIIPYFFGNAGVYLFFAISGFLMVHVTGSREQSARAFLKARAIRIIPIYWFYTLGTAVMMFLLPFLFRGNELSASHFILSLLFIPHRTATDPDTFLPMVRVGWTLIYEVFFYGLFAAAMAVSFRHRAMLTAAVLSVLVMLYVWLNPSIQVLFPLFVYGDPIILQFVLGMVTAYAMRNSSALKISPTHFAAALILAIAVMHVGNGGTNMSSLARFALYGMPSAIVVLLSLLVKDQERFDRPVISILGDSSYSIYLVHMLPLALMRWVWTRLHMPVEGVGWAMLFIATATVLAALCGVVSYRFVEFPAMRFLKSRLAG